MHRSLPFFLVLIVALAACAGGGGAWVKPGVSDEQHRADQRACRTQAEEAFGRGLETTSDIRTASPGGRADTRDLVTSSRDYRDARKYEQIYGRCMESKGYVRR